MYHEDDYIMLSALQHYLFCPRQCALIHLEQTWDENRLTVLGNILHEHVHEQGREKRGDVITVRGLRLASERLGLSGQADVVEFHRSPASRLRSMTGERAPSGERSPSEVEERAPSGVEGCALPNDSGLWQPFPVEYKRGKPKKDLSDAVQLCAQALCLEEMLNCTIPDGALFYGAERRRKDVAFDQQLREATERCVTAVHELLQSGQTPLPVPDKRCGNCSLNERCLPETLSKRLSGYYKRLMDGDD